MSRLRIVAALLSTLLGVGLVGVLVADQATLEPPAAMPQEQVFVSSPLVGLVPTVARRADVLALLGLEGTLRQRVEDGLRRYDGREAQLADGLKRARRETLAGAFCPHDLPPFYRAAILLVEGERDATKVISPLDERFGVEWTGFPGRDVSTLFDTWEQRRERQPGDSLLALAALVTGHVEDAIGQRAAPFQRFVSEGGGLSSVAAENADVERLLGDYLAAVLAISGVVAASPDAYGCTGPATTVDKP